MSLRFLVALTCFLSITGGTASLSAGQTGRAATPQTGRAAGAAARVVNLTGDDKMQYSVRLIRVKPGERIRVRLTSIGVTPKIVMAHNFVLLKAGTDPKAFAETGAAFKDVDYIAPKLKGQVLAQSTMVGPAERAEVTFTAPTAPGKYIYLCTFPGHYAAGMWGELVVG